MRLIERPSSTPSITNIFLICRSPLWRTLSAAGLRVWDVEELPTHGGSLRVYGCHAGAAIAPTNRVDSLLTREDQFGLTRLATYSEFQKRAERVKDDLLVFLIEQKRAGRLWPPMVPLPKATPC